MPHRGLSVLINPNSVLETRRTPTDMDVFEHNGGAKSRWAEMGFEVVIRVAASVGGESRSGDVASR